MVGRVEVCAALVLALGTGRAARPLRSPHATPPQAIQRHATPPHAPRPCATQAPRDPAFEDARLCDVAFVDLQNGWAVGDRGVIWHTADGGRRWELQASGVDCQLSAVRFLDARHGWAVGGRVKPYAETTAGVLLETRDGGATWQQDRKLLLPALRDVKFFDARRGCAVGDRSALFPLGVFGTEDGGRSWSALGADEGACWLAGDFSAPGRGIIVGRSGAIGSVRGRSVESQAADVGLPALQRVRLASPDEAWIVGDGGLVRHSTDGGQNWQPAAGELPPQAGLFDFQALAVLREHCWVAGTPGTQVLRTADAGHTWQSGPTGQNLPIRSLAFVDERHGWAVGELGLILATSDGGQTWQRQRSGGSRAALLDFCSRARDVPLEMLARLANEEGYLSVVEVLNRQDLDARRGTGLDLASAVHEAVVRCGGSSASCAWQFPVREPLLKLSARQLVAPWETAGAGPALTALDAHLVRQIRTWRPSVVVVPDSGPQADPAALLVAQAVLQAVDRAGQSEHWPEQIEQAGLQAWKVEKVFSALPPDSSGAVSLGTAELSPRSGRSLAELAAAARGLMSAEFEPPPPALGFRLLIDRLPQERGARDFFAGIVIGPRSDARRALVSVSDASLDRVRQSTQTRRNLQAILGQANRSDAEAGRWLAEVGPFTQGLDETSASELLFQLAWRYYRSGRWDLAAETFEMITIRYPENPLAAASLVWLVQYYSSGEAAWRMTKTQQIGVQQVTALEPAAGLGRRAQPIPARPPGQVVSAAAGLIAGPDGAQTWPARAAALGKKLEQTDPALLAEPRVRFPLAVAETRGGQARRPSDFTRPGAGPRPTIPGRARPPSNSGFPRTMARRPRR